MLEDILLPIDSQLQIARVRVEQDETVVITVASSAPTVCCPYCGVRATKIHSRYQRHPADLACVGHVVRLSLQVRRFFCDNSNCRYRTFAEQFPVLLSPRARRTTRLARRQEQIAFEVGGEAGARILEWLRMPVSPDTLLRLVRAAPEEAVVVPRVLGVDDWASRRGVIYGTILVDLEKRKVIELLPERSAAVFEKWLKEHPGVRIIARDRGGEYIKGATAGAPDAVQVADRWHLLKNVREMLEQFLQNRRACLKAAAEVDEESTTAVPTEMSRGDNDGSYRIVRKARQRKGPTKEEQAKQARRVKREERYQRVLELKAAGFSNRAIRDELGMHTKTVRKYLEAESCPFYPENRVTPGKVTAYEAYLERRWQEGCYNATQLWREITKMGFNGSRVAVSRWATKQRRLLPESGSRFPTATTLPQPKKRHKRLGPWTPARAAWLLLKSEETLTDKEKRTLERMFAADQTVATAHCFVQQFTHMIRQREANSLIPWIQDALCSGVPALARFARHLLNDFPAVHNALSLPWSNGQTEGQIHRLKLVKRQMYGRANFDLLRRRVLGLPRPP